MRTVRVVVPAFVLMFWLGMLPCRAGQELLQPVEFQHIRIGGFWKQQIKQLTEKWLPHCIRQMEAGGAGKELMNLVHTAKVIRGEPHGKYTGAPWSWAAPVFCTRGYESMGWVIGNGYQGFGCAAAG